jgi:2-polyprenyl-6-methoxyphenol hydroxylase-like FAD-dependent oxidoreductase
MERPELNPHAHAASRFDVCVQGSGAVGMCLALSLSRLGHSVAFCEPPAGRAGAHGEWDDIRTYALSATSIKLLQQLKVWDALPDDARSAVAHMHVHGDAPGHTLNFAAGLADGGPLAWIVDASELDRALTMALRFAPHVQRVPAPVPAALLALAEGRDGSVRQALGVSIQRHDYGQHALATRVVSSQPHQGVASQWFSSPEVLALLPFERPAAGASYGVVWSVSQARSEELMALDDAALGEALTDATQGSVGSLKLAGPRACWPLQLAQAEPVCGEGWVLLGDAAHVIHPLAGQGLNLGLADVVALCQVIEQRESFRALGDAKLLRRYARARGGAVRAMGQVTDGLLELFAHSNPMARSLRNQGLSMVNALNPLKRLLVEQALRS